MSGIKTTTIDVDLRASLLLRVNGEMDQAVRETKAIKRRLFSFIEETEQIVAVDNSIEETLSTLKNQLEDEGKEITARLKLLDGISLPESARAVNANRINHTSSNVTRIQEQNHATELLLETSVSKISALMDADKTLSAAEMALRKLNDSIEYSGELLTKWSAGYDEFLSTRHSVAQAFIRCRSNLENGDEPQDLVTEAARIEEAARQLKGSLDAESAEAERKEVLQQKRIYVLKALRETCTRLGFEEVTGPTYRGERSAPLAITMDTLNQGPMTFLLHLDGHLESDSGIQIGACDEEHAKITELLGEIYGIGTEFKRADDDMPELLTSKEKPSPRNSKKDIKAHTQQQRMHHG